MSTVDARSIERRDKSEGEANSEASIGAGCVRPDEWMLCSGFTAQQRDAGLRRQLIGGDGDVICVGRVAHLVSGRRYGLFVILMPGVSVLRGVCVGGAIRGTRGWLRPCCEC